MTAIDDYRKLFGAKHPESIAGFNRLVAKLAKSKMEVLNEPSSKVMDAELDSEETRALVLLIELMLEKHGMLDRALAPVCKYGPALVVVVDKLLNMKPP